MSENFCLQIDDIDIDVVRKNIKNIHLAVYPPDARVRISSPISYDEETIKLFAVSKWAWIKRNIEIIKGQNRISAREFVSGESHYLFGKRYLMELVYGDKAFVDIKGINKIIMAVKPTYDKDDKKKLMEKWYRKMLFDKLSILVPKWEEITNLKIENWKIKKMQTRWGSCKIDEKVIILNLELAKKSIQEIEYVILHELAHLVERTHNRNFTIFLDKYMPNWRLYKANLNSLSFDD